MNLDTKLHFQEHLENNKTIGLLQNLLTVLPQLSLLAYTNFASILTLMAGRFLLTKNMLVLFIRKSSE